MANGNENLRALEVRKNEADRNLICALEKWQKEMQALVGPICDTERSGEVDAALMSELYKLKGEVIASYMKSHIIRNIVNEL